MTKWEHFMGLIIDVMVIITNWVGIKQKMKSCIKKLLQRILSADLWILVIRYVANFQNFNCRYAGLDSFKLFQIEIATGRED
jgi:hypothetical protein